MAFGLDHAFICASFEAPEADRLADFGLTEGARNTHPGQGTACRRFFFHNTYLELLWVNDPAEAQSESVRATRLWERWVGRMVGVCPFGFCFRPTAAVGGGDPPFASWLYRPPYMPGPTGIAVATNSDLLAEPMLVHLPVNRRPDASPAGRRQPLEHAAGLREITRAELVSPHAHRISAELQAVIHAGLIRLRGGGEYLLELGFDGESQGQSADFRPGLPLIFRR